MDLVQRPSARLVKGLADLRRQVMAGNRVSSSVELRGGGEGLEGEDGGLPRRLVPLPNP